jgi:hypothetical protein
MLPMAFRTASFVPAEELKATLWFFHVVFFVFLDSRWEDIKRY